MALTPRTIIRSILTDPSVPAVRKPNEVSFWQGGGDGDGEGEGSSPESTTSPKTLLKAVLRSTEMGSRTSLPSSNNSSVDNIDNNNDAVSLLSFHFCYFISTLTKIRKQSRNHHLKTPLVQGPYSKQPLEAMNLLCNIGPLFLWRKVLPLI